MSHPPAMVENMTDTTALGIALGGFLTGFAIGAFLAAGATGYRLHQVSRELELERELREWPPEVTLIRDGTSLGPGVTVEDYYHGPTTTTIGAELELEPPETEEP